MGIKRSQDRKIECELNTKLVSLCAKRFGARQWSFLGLGSEKKWFSICEDSTQGEWDRNAEQMKFTFAEGTHPVFRSTSPLSRGVLKNIGGGKLSIHHCANQRMIETVLRTIISVNQLSLYGADADLCEECKTCHFTTRRLAVEGQSNPLFVPNVMKISIPLAGDRAQVEDLLRRKCRISDHN